MPGSRFTTLLWLGPATASQVPGEEAGVDPRGHGEMAVGAGSSYRHYGNAATAQLPAGCILPSALRRFFSALRSLRAALRILRSWFHK